MAYTTLSEINDDVLWTVMSFFEAVELLHFGMTCKRFWASICSPKLWLQLARSLQENDWPLPLYEDETLEDLSVECLRAITARACSLQRNLASSDTRLLRFVNMKAGWNLFKSRALPFDAQDCIRLFEGKWLIYRRPNTICIRHIESTKSKGVLEIPVIMYVGWRLEVARKEKNVALVGVRQDVKENWQLLEITFGKKADTPKVRPIPLPETPYLSLVGRMYAVVRREGPERLLNIYTGQEITIDSNPVGDKSHLIAGNYLFTAFSRPGGRIHISAARLGQEKERLISTIRSKYVIRLKEACHSFPPDEYSAETTLRPSTIPSQITIWHRIPDMRHKSSHFLFIVELSYSILEEDEKIEWGLWRFRSGYEGPGTHYIGDSGHSALKVRYGSRRAYLTLFPRLQIPVNNGHMEIARVGMRLPSPEESCIGDDPLSIRMCWDDASGIAVLMHENGVIWVLHYA